MCSTASDLALLPKKEEFRAQDLYGFGPFGVLEFRVWDFRVWEFARSRLES